MVVGVVVLGVGLMWWRRNLVKSLWLLYDMVIRRCLIEGCGSCR